MVMLKNNVDGRVPDNTNHFFFFKKLNPVTYVLLLLILTKMALLKDKSK